MRRVCCFILLTVFFNVGLCQTIRIGNQVWSQKNLDVSTFRNGDSIPEAKSNEAWNAYATKGLPAWCYFGNDPDNDETFGKLYNWYAVNDSRGLAPAGWRIPSDQDWNTLTESIGGKANGGSLLKAKEGWEEEGNGVDSCGFSALPGGIRIHGSGKFDLMGLYGCWWTATESSPTDAWLRTLRSNSPEVSRNFPNKGNGFSVRCIQ